MRLIVNQPSVVTTQGRFPAVWPPTLIYQRTKNLRAVQLLLGHTKLESTVRYLGIEVEDALEMAEQTDAQPKEAGRQLTGLTCGLFSIFLLDSSLSLLRWLAHI